MRLTSLARRYASALFRVARDTNLIDKVESDLGMIIHTMENVPILAETLTNPLITIGRKKSIVQEIFKDKIESLTLDFLNLLIDRRREKILSDVEIEYISFADNWRGVITAEVKTAVQLTEDEQARLSVKLGILTGKNIRLELAQDESLIGGLTVKIGDTIVDGSVKGYLADLKAKLLDKA